MDRLDCANTDVDYPGRNRYALSQLASRYLARLLIGGSNSRAWQHGTCTLCLIPSSRVGSMLSLGESGRDRLEKIADPDMQLMSFGSGRPRQPLRWSGPGRSFFAAHTVLGYLILTIVSGSGSSGSNATASMEKPGSPFSGQSPYSEDG